MIRKRKSNIDQGNFITRSRKSSGSEIILTRSEKKKDNRGRKKKFKVSDPEESTMDRIYNKDLAHPMFDKDRELELLALELGDDGLAGSIDSWQWKEETLTLLEYNFVHEYIIRGGDLKATCNALDMSISRGYSFLRKEKIRREISLNVEYRAARINTTQDKVISEIAKIAFANAKDFYDDTGKLKDISDLPKDLVAAIKKVTQKEFTSGKTGNTTVQTVFELESKAKALDSLVNLLGMKQTKISIDQNVKTEQEININLDGLSIEELKLLAKVSDSKKFLEAREVIDCQALPSAD